MNNIPALGNETFWEVLVPINVILWAILALEALIFWVLETYMEEIQWLIGKIPAVRRYRERCFWDSLERGELCMLISRTDPETGTVFECEVPIPPVLVPEDQDDSVECAPDGDSAISEVPDAPSPPA